MRYRIPGQGLERPSFLHLTQHLHACNTLVYYNGRRTIIVYGGGGILGSPGPRHYILMR